MRVQQGVGQQPYSALCNCANIFSFSHAQQVEGYDFNQGVDYEKLLGSFLNTGFQATNVGLAIEEMNAMVGITLDLNGASVWC